MSRVYLYNSKKTGGLLKLILCLLIPFALYGIYKNGIFLYLHKHVGVFEMLYPVFYIVISLVISFIYSKVTKEKLLGYNLLNNLLIALITIPGTNLLVYLVLILLVNVLSKFIKLNTSALYMILLIILMLILKDYSFLNVYEASASHKFVFMDYLIGRGYGGAGNTLLVMSIVSFGVLLTKMEYKSDIPILAFISYYLLAFVTAAFTGKLEPNLLLNSNVIFAFIFLAPISVYSPYLKGASFIYGLALGILTYALSFIEVNLGVYIVILLLSLTAKYFDNFIAGK